MRWAQQFLPAEKDMITDALMDNVDPEAPGGSNGSAGDQGAHSVESGSPALLDWRTQGARVAVGSDIPWTDKSARELRELQAGYGLGDEEESDVLRAAEGNDPQDVFRG